MSATGEERFFDAVAKLPRSESTELRWQTSATDSSKVVARAFVAIDVNSLCSLLFSPQSAFAVSQSCLTAKSPPPPAVRCPRVPLAMCVPRPSLMRDNMSCVRSVPTKRGGTGTILRRRGHQNMIAVWHPKLAGERKATSAESISAAPASALSIRLR